MTKLAYKPVFLLLAALIIAGGLLLPAVQPARAAGPYTVNTTNDTEDNNPGDGICADLGGQCSLRAAVEETTVSGSATINVPAGTYTLSLGTLDIAPTGGLAITITGTGLGSKVIQGSGTDRVMTIDAAGNGNTQVTLNGLTISGGRDSADHNGGAGIYAGSQNATPVDTLTLQNCTVTGNQVVPGGAGTFEPGGGVLMNGGNLSVSNCTFSNNTATNATGIASFGGAIAYLAQSVAGTLTISGSTFSNNSMVNASGATGAGGGAVYIDSIAGSTETITGSTFSGNSAAGGGSGGAILVDGAGSLSVSTSTFTGNTASASGMLGGEGGGIFVLGGFTNVAFSRLVGNTAPTAGSGIYNEGNNGANTLAINNWWGCNAGPGNPGCDTAVNSTLPNITTDPRIVVTNAASPATILTGAATTVTADVLHNSAGNSLTLANASTLIGLPVTWTGDSLGSLSGQQTAIQANGTATATFTAGIEAGTAQVSAGLDNANVPAAILINSAPADLSVVKTAAATVVAGNNLTYTITLTNTGAGDAQSVVLSDTLPVGTTFVSQQQVSGPTFSLSHNGNAVTDSLVAMANGASAVFQIVASVDPSLLPDTQIANTASVASANDPDNNNDASTATTTVETQADVQVVKTAPAAVAPGGALTYTITVTNAGPSDAADVGLADTLPAGVTFVSQSQTSGPTFNLSNTTGSIDNTINPLPAGSTAVFSVVTAVDANAAGGTVLSNTATVSASTDDPTPANNSSTANTEVRFAPGITSGSTATFTIGVLSKFIVRTTGFPIPAITETGALPAGMALVDIHDGTATLGGIPDPGTAGTYPITIKAANGILPDATQSFTLIVQKDTPTLQLSAAPPTQSTFGQSVTFTLSVSSADGTPTGTVQFKLDGSDLGTPVTLSSGSAALSTAALAAGTHSITAVYSGDSTFSGATSDPLSYTVVKATPTLALSAAPPTQSTFGQSVTFTLTVSSTAGVPAGTVQFKQGSSNLGAPVTLSSGSAALSTAALAAGPYSITAVYSGDANFEGATSAALDYTVNPAATTTALTFAASSSPLGIPLTFTATVAAVAPGAGTPTGSVEFKDGSTVLSTLPLNSGGVAQLVTFAMPSGSHFITATYIPAGGNFLASSKTLAVTVAWHVLLPVIFK